MNLVIEFKGKTEIIKIDRTIYDAFNENKIFNEKYCTINEDTIIVNEIFFSESTRVKDCIRRLHIDPYLNKSDILLPSSNHPVENSTVLILESPHKDEYTDDFQQLTPANGISGVRIYNFRKRIFPDELGEIIICNPVQWQASLYALHNKSMYNYTFKKLKNDVWSFLWNESKIEFIDRLKKYNPQIIINSCTSSLKKKVQDEINKYFQEKQLYKTYHPARWSKTITKKCICN